MGGGTVEAWALAFVEGRVLEQKLSPPPAPSAFLESSEAIRVERPGRPPELVSRSAKKKTPRPGALRDPRRRAELLHTFLHHELQAAELMGWAILAFPSAPLAFRRGLLGILKDELRHVGLYREHLLELGHPFGTFPINDWFWDRVPGCTGPEGFVARMGIAFEGGNLDHAVRFAEQLEAAGDRRAAEIQRQIAEEEIPHVSFAIHWFQELTGGLDFDRWRAELPVPLSPMMARGRPMSEAARRRAGFSEAFLERLRTW
jgi:uncharacterized ferritin-like protein (DUF455 family)